VGTADPLSSPTHPTRASMGTKWFIARLRLYLRNITFKSKNDQSLKMLPKVCFDNFESYKKEKKKYIYFLPNMQTFTRHSFLSTS
jgi:hypothetical protein